MAGVKIIRKNARVNRSSPNIFDHSVYMFYGVTMGLGTLRQILYKIAFPNRTIWIILLFTNLLAILNPLKWQKSWRRKFMRFAKDLVQYYDNRQNVFDFSDSEWIFRPCTFRPIPTATRVRCAWVVSPLPRYIVTFGDIDHYCALAKRCC